MRTSRQETPIFQKRRLSFGREWLSFVWPWAIFPSFHLHWRRSTDSNFLRSAASRYGIFIHLLGEQPQKILGGCRGLDYCDSGRGLADEAVHFHRVSVFVSDSF